jgi:hypothetical protein
MLYMGDTYAGLDNYVNVQGKTVTLKGLGGP